MNDYSNRAVSRALTVMDVLSNASRGMLLTEIASAAELDRATTYRLLHVLAARGYAHRDEASKRYSRRFKLNGNTRRELPGIAAHIARAALQDLHAETGAAISMASLLGTEICYYQEYLGRDQLGHAELFRGKRLPSHATACGKALLAGQPVSELGRIYEYMPLHAYTPQTIRTVAALREALWATRETGFATAKGEFEPGRLCIALSVRTPAGVEPLALSVSLPAQQAERQSLEAIVDRLRRTANRVGDMLETSESVLAQAM